MPQLMRALKGSQCIPLSPHTRILHNSLTSGWYLPLPTDWLIGSYIMRKFKIIRETFEDFVVLRVHCMFTALQDVSSTLWNMTTFYTPCGAHHQNLNTAPYDKWVANRKISANKAQLNWARMQCIILEGWCSNLKLSASVYRQSKAVTQNIMAIHLNV